MMTTCSRCGVRLLEGSKCCPLCGRESDAKPLETMPQGSIDMELIYPIDATPEPLEGLRVECTRRHGWELYILCSLIACVVVLGANYLDTRAISWSLFPVAGIAYLFIAVGMFAAGRRHQKAAFVTFATATLAFLYVLDALEPSRAWFAQLGLPIASLALGLGALLATITKRIRKKGLHVIALWLIGCVALCIGLEAIIDRAKNGSIDIGWSALVAIVCSPIVLLLLYLHHRIVNLAGRLHH